MVNISSRLFCFPEELEADFQRTDSLDSVRPVRIAITLMLALYALFSITGFFLYDNLDPVSVRIYSTQLIPGTLLWLLLANSKWSERYIHAITLAGLIAIVIPGHARFIMCVSTRSSLFEPTASAIFAMLICIGLRLPFLRAAVTSILACVFWMVVHATTEGGMTGAKLMGAPFYLFAANTIGLSAAYLIEAQRRRGFLQQREIDQQRLESDKLLLNVLPPSIAKRLKAGEEHIVDRCERTTVLFADIVGYTRLAGSVEPEVLLKMLTTIFRRFDEIMTEVGMEKIKTIGDAYMAAAGVPEACQRPEKCAAKAAILMRSSLEKINSELGLSLMIRIGIHSGPVMAGVIGCQKFSYDLWGDTVNFASRLESHGLPGRIHISEDVREALNGDFRCIPRGPVEIKGKGERETFWLEPAAAFSPLTTSTSSST